MKILAVQRLSQSFAATAKNSYLQPQRALVHRKARLTRAFVSTGNTLARYVPHPRKRVNLKRKRFGKLKVIRPARRVWSGRQYKPYWWVRCDCGTLKRICQYNLMFNYTRSCGCACAQAVKRIDLTGKKFGRWTVLRQDKKVTRHKKTRWVCRCECGTKKSVESTVLRRGTSTNCGCVRLGQDLTGQKFGHWTVQRLGKKSGWRMNGWVCRCQCGAEKIVRTQDLTEGKSKSCGCAHRSPVDKLTRNSYYSMLQRCHYPGNTSYDRYGGRGIWVCLRWQESILNFLEDMGPRPSKELTLDRIDPSGNYTPENCRWADKETQAQNQCRYKKPGEPGYVDPLHIPEPGAFEGDATF
jgi:hypothetical protein